MANALSIDIGSSSVRCCVGTIGEQGLSIETVHRFSEHTTRRDDEHLWDMEALLSGIGEGLRRAERRAGSVDTLAIDATAGDFGLLADGELLREPYFYRDPNLYSTIDELETQQSPIEMFLETGYYGAPGPLHYQARHDAELFEQAETIVPLPQLLSYELGGEPVAEKSFATTLRVFDIRSESWARDLLDALELPTDPLPEIAPAGMPVGTLKGDAVSSVESEPTIVLSPSHDTASAVGALPLSRANNAFLCTGSWFIPGLELPEPIVTREAYHTPASNEVGVEGSVRFLHNLPGFSLLEYCRERWETEGKTADYGALLDAAAEVDPDGPLIEVDADLFMDAQFEGGVKEAIETYCVQTDQPVPRTEAEVTSVILTSLAVKSAVVLFDLLEVAEETVGRVHLAGGGVRNALFCRRFASAVGMPVHAGPIEATAIGNVLSQFRYVGDIDSFKTGREYVKSGTNIDVYEPKDREKWIDIVDRLRSLPT